MEHRVDEALLVHGAPERREMDTVGILERTQENPDGGDAPEHRGTRLGMRLLLERALVADMHMRIEDAGQHQLASRVKNFGAVAELLAERNDATARNAHIRFDAPDAGDHQGAIADN